MPLRTRVGILDHLITAIDFPNRSLPRCYPIANADLFAFSRHPKITIGAFVEGFKGKKNDALRLWIGLLCWGQFS